MQIIKDCDWIKEAVKESAPMKSTIITKVKHGLISGMKNCWLDE